MYCEEQGAKKGEILKSGDQKGDRHSLFTDKIRSKKIEDNKDGHFGK